MRHAQRLVHRRYLDRPSCRHRITRVERKIHKRELEFGHIDLERPEARRNVGPNHDVAR